MAVPLVLRKSFYTFWLFLVRVLFRLYNAFQMKHKVTRGSGDNEILNISGRHIAERIRGRIISAERVMEIFVERATEVNGIINGIAEACVDRALSEARRLDAQLSLLEPPARLLDSEQTPFLGVPLSVKEHYKIEGMCCSSGLYSMRDSRSDITAPVVQQLINAGAIPFCTTNLSELCVLIETHNYIYGRTNNPYDTRRTCGGSSGGEGALLGSGASVIGVGSDVAGSIRMPAFFCGVFGHKPSPRIVSNAGRFPESWGTSFDRVAVTGPMCRYADDLMPILKTMLYDSESTLPLLKLNEPIEITPETKVFFCVDAPKKDYKSFPMTSHVENAVLRAAKIFELFGCQVKELEDFNELGLGMGMFSITVSDPSLPSFSSQLAIGKPEKTIDPLSEALRNARGQSRHTIPSLLYAWLTREGRLPFLLENPEDVQYLRDFIRKRLTELLGNDSILLYPSHMSQAPFHNLPLFAIHNANPTAIWNALGFPATQVPGLMGKNGLPTGLQVVATPFNDRLCISAAQFLSKNGFIWTPPWK